MSLLNLHHTLCSGKLVSVHPLPTNHDPLTPLLHQHFPAHARPARLQAGLQEGEFTGTRFEEACERLKTSQRWRALADLTVNELSRKRGSSPSPAVEDVHDILHLWSIRLACLRRLGFYAIMSSESSALFSALGAPYTRPLVHTSDEFIFNPVYPLHLVQLWALSPLFVGGDRFLVIRQLREVSHRCKQEYRRTKDTIWKENLISTMLVLANILLDMQEYAQVERILQAVKDESKDVASTIYLYLFYLDMGDVEQASSLLDGLADMPQSTDHQKALKGILQLAQGQMVAGEDQLELSEDSEDLVGQNNLAVSCLYTGRIGHGIELLEASSRRSAPSFFNEETCISNLVTLQELQSGDQLANKLSLLREASKHSSESIRPDCLRLG